MSAREVIRLFDALPAAERKEVADHVMKSEEASGIRRASADDVKQVMERVFSNNDELFRKLAQ